uniref:Putative secreted protein n=1 Tax=Ixodes ricinus TaxID=34613 RepID=A0A6B0UHB4_IXORI
MFVLLHGFFCLTKRAKSSTLGVCAHFKTITPPREWLANNLVCILRQFMFALWDVWCSGMCRLNYVALGLQHLGFGGGIDLVRRQPIGPCSLVFQDEHQIFA